MFSPKQAYNRILGMNDEDLSQRLILDESVSRVQKDEE